MDDQYGAMDTADTPGEARGRISYPSDGHHDTAAAKDISPLDNAMNAHRNAISDLAGETRMLQVQLATVMQPVPESGDMLRSDTPSPPRSPHVADLHEQTERIQEQIDLLRAIRQYLDVR